MTKGETKLQHKNVERIKNFLFIFFGASLIAISFNVFLLPNKIAPGGVIGISTSLNGLFGWEPAYVQWSLNFHLFIAGIIILGYQYVIKTLFGTLYVPFVVLLLMYWEQWPLTHRL